MKDTTITKDMIMPEIFQRRVKEMGDEPCVFKKNSNGVFEEISWNRMDAMVRSLGLYCISKGIKRGDKVAIFSPNRYEWWVSDMGSISIGATTVPIYATNTAVEAQYILANSDSRICFVGTREHLDKVLEVRKKLPRLLEIIVFDEIDKKIKGVKTFSEALKAGAAVKDATLFDKRLRAIKPDSLITFIYTSGTTGDPKGVMLSHRNIMTNVDQHFSAFPMFINEEQTVLSFLPLSHVFERTLVYYGCIYAGIKVYFAENINTVLDDLKLSKPTLIATVPRLLEKMRAGVYGKVATAPAVKKALFKWAMSVGKRNMDYVCNGVERRGLFAYQYNLANKLIFSKLKAALGIEHLRYVGCGGAPLNPLDAQFFIGMGIHIVEGFGLSETSPVTNFNTIGHIRLGTVGLPVKNTEVRIGPGDEILIRGPQLMVGYYKNRSATREAFTRDGFLRTGDTGVIDAEGNLIITGRLKDIIITSGGKNISPQNIENSLKESPFIEQVAVIGDNRNYLTALIVPSFPDLEAWAEKRAVTSNSREELLLNQKVKELFDAEVKKRMKGFGRVEEIKKYRLIPNEWTQTSGELTPTLKLKRRVINSRYSSLIDEMYKENSIKM